MNTLRTTRAKTVSLVRVLLWLLASVWGTTGIAHAQHPLCPAPTADDQFFYTCRPGTTDKVAQFIYDLTVRHVMKTEGGFDLDTAALLEVLDLQNIFDPKLPEVKALVTDRPAVHFTPLDSTTGEFISKGPAKAARTLKVSNEKLGITIEVTIPEVVQGLYWRSPAHVELQFYKGHGVRFRLTGRAVTEFEDVLECVSITAGRARATTADPTHRYLMTFFDSCP